MRLLTWNILHGGSALRGPGLSRVVAEIDPDVAILTEFRPGPSELLSTRLARLGWHHVLVSKARPKQNGVAVVSKTPLTCGTLGAVPGSESFTELSRQGWIDAFRALHGGTVEHSWWSRTGAFRIDHAFLRPGLRNRLRRAEYVRRTSSDSSSRTVEAGDARG